MAIGEKVLADRKRLYEIVKDSAEKNRTYFLGWMVFALYILITVASTSDLQLLIPDIGVQLPLLGVQLPLLSFYLAAPFIVIAVHFNLQQNLDSHAYKLKRWYEAWDKHPPRDEIQAFLFDFAALEKGGAFEMLVRLASSVLFYWLGPIVLFFIFVRFSDYQNTSYTTYHFVILLAGLIISVRACLKLPVFRGTGFFLRLGEFSIPLLITIVAMPTLCLTAALDADWPSAHIMMAKISKWDEGQSFFRELLLPRLVLTANAVVGSLDSQIELKAKTEDQVVAGWWRDQGHGIDLKRRNLQYASLVGVDLRKADLSETRLNGSDLRNIRLQGASAVSANFAAANFYGAQLQGANFRFGDFRATRFVQSNLNGADLSGASFEGSYLEESQFVGTEFYETRVAGAVFLNVPIYTDPTWRGTPLIATADVLFRKTVRLDEIERRMPNAISSDRIKRLIRFKDEIDDHLQSLDDSREKQQKFDVTSSDGLLLSELTLSVARAWCSSEKSRKMHFLPGMADHVAFVWPVSREASSLESRAGIFLDEEQIRGALISQLARAPDCTPYREYICARALTGRLKNLPSECR